MINKKGQENWLGKELGATLLGVLALIALIGFGVLIFNLFSKASAKEQASSNLDEIVSKINDLQASTKTDDFRTSIITGPKDWYMVYYDQQVLAGDLQKGVPAQCGTLDCLCICPSSLSRNDLDNPKDIIYKDYFYYGGNKPVAYNSGSGGISYFKSDGIDLCQSRGVCKSLSLKLKMDQLNTYIVRSFLIKTVPVPYLTNWVAISPAPIEVKIAKDGEKISIIDTSKAYQEGQIIRNLLDKDISYNNKERKFSEFLIEEVGGNCENPEFDFSQAKSSAKNEISSYIAELKGGEISDANIDVYLIILGEKVISLNDGAISSIPTGGKVPTSNVETKKLCESSDGKVLLYIKSEVKKNV